MLGLDNADWLYSFGLVDGWIPAGKPCPFYNECESQEDLRIQGPCPHEGNLLEERHSCGLCCAMSRAKLRESSIK